MILFFLSIIVFVSRSNFHAKFYLIKSCLSNLVQTLAYFYLIPCSKNVELFSQILILFLPHTLYSCANPHIVKNVFLDYSYGSFHSECSKSMDQKQVGADWQFVVFWKVASKQICILRMK